MNQTTEHVRSETEAFVNQAFTDLKNARGARAWVRDQRNVQQYQEVLRNAEEAYANDPGKDNALYNSIQRLRFVVGKKIEQYGSTGPSVRPRRAVGSTISQSGHTRPAGR